MDGTTRTPIIQRRWLPFGVRELLILTIIAAMAMYYFAARHTGIARPTERELDIALDGPGYFELLDTNTGQFLYTRFGQLRPWKDGKFYVGSPADGFQLNAGGLPNNRYFQDLHVSNDGWISYRLISRCRLKTKARIVNFENEEGLREVAPQIFTATAESGEPIEMDILTERPHVKQGWLEGAVTMPPAPHYFVEGILLICIVYLVFQYLTLRAQVTSKQSRARAKQSELRTEQTVMDQTTHPTGKRRWWQFGFREPCILAIIAAMVMYYYTAPYTDELRRTNHKFDMAFDGPGYFAVIDENKLEQYFTRYGRFRPARDGNFYLGNLRVGVTGMPNNRQFRDFQVTKDGYMSYKIGEGDILSDIKIVTFENEEELLEVEPNIFVSTRDSGLPIYMNRQTEKPNLKQGWLEGGRSVPPVPHYCFVGLLFVSIVCLVFENRTLRGQVPSKKPNKFVAGDIQ